MADAVGVASSVTAFIKNILTLINYVKDVYNTPAEISQFLKELKFLKIYLSAVDELISRSTENGPWLKTLKQLDNNPPDSVFNELMKLLEELDGKLRVTPPQWKMVKKRLLWTLTKTSVEEDLKRIERLKTLVMSAVQVDHITLSHAMVADVKGTVDVVLIADDKAEKVARWLTPSDYVAVQQGKLKERVGNTGEWFLESPGFMSWKDGSTESRTLWCPGSPGIGKSVLASIIVNALQSPIYEKTLVQQKTLVLSIFCDRQSANTQTVENVLRSLLKQRVQAHGLSDSITFLYDNNTRLFFDDLTEVLVEELKSFDRVYIILDALDEFPENDGGQEKLINALRTLGTSLFKTDTRLDIRAADEDIKTYIMSKLSSGRLAHHIKGRDHMRGEILSGVTAKADGIFLLACIHMASLAEAKSRKSLRGTLRKLSGNIWEAYDNALERINCQSKDRKELAYRILGWIAFARHPLTVSELRYALAVEPAMLALDLDDEDVLGDFCAGLVIIRLESIFMTADAPNSFLACKRPSRAPVCHMSSLGDFALPLDAKNDNVLRGLAEKHPFLHYSSAHWGYHASGAVEHSMEDEIIAFLTDGIDLTNRRRVANIFHRRTISNEAPMPIQFAMDYGLVHIMDVLLLRGNCECKEPLLLIAVQRGDLKMVKLLLERDNVNPNARSPSSQQTPLLYAVEQREHTHIVEMLLRSGRVDVNIKGSNGRTPL
ncbi:hypothetical protein EV421DRAFT_1739854 [Armillaria borealis]|uniref:Nephrocystin 3-like N-terminal domain-containing protein n=1 Tax=Armillaria borealis TaxID=47425 RepID=A0AA39MID8_9AGAR|nr:hypothetical protein EV421DRAFT_1739854 [Armillaria borealis]